MASSIVPARVSHSLPPVPVAGVHPVRGHLPVPCAAPDLDVGVHHPLGELPDHLPQQIRARRRQRLLERVPRNGHNVTCGHFALLRCFRNHFEGSRGGRLASRRHAVLRQLSHTSTGYPIHHFRGRERRGSPCVGDSGARPAAGRAPEHLGQLASGHRIAWALSRYAATGASLSAAASGTAWSRCPLAGMADGPATRAAGWGVWSGVSRSPRRGELGAGRCGRGRTPCSAAGRSFAEVPGRRPVFCRPGRADEPDQELILWGTNRTYAGCFTVVPAQRLVLVVP